MNDVGKKDGDQLPFSLNGASGGQDFVGEEFWGVGLWIIIVFYEDRLGLSQVITTLSAELVSFDDPSLALWALHLVTPRSMVRESKGDLKSWVEANDGPVDFFYLTYLLLE